MLGAGESKEKSLGERGVFCDMEGIRPIISGVVLTGLGTGSQVTVKSREQLMHGPWNSVQCPLRPPSGMDTQNQRGTGW